MADVSIDDVLQFNDELIALSRSGVPLDLGMDARGETIVERLDRISAALVSRVRAGQATEQAIAEETLLPPRYRAAVLTWLRTGDPTIALNAVASPAQEQRQFGQSLACSLAYPLILFGLVYLGFLYLCSVTAPKIEAIYGQLWETPSTSLSFLTAARQSMPVWGIAIPVLVAILIWWSRRQARDATWRWVPGSSSYFSATKNAGVANQLAALLESGCSRDESIALVAPSSNVASHGKGSSFKTASFPPLLHWAVTSDLGGESLPQVLRFVARTYQQKAARQHAIWRFIVPTVCGVAVGGLLVLAYGLGLFLPVIQLLKDVALPVGV